MGLGNSGSHSRHTAITGLGIVSCIGTSLDEVTESLRTGRSGIVLDPQRRERGFRSALTGAIRGFDPRAAGMTRKMLRTMDGMTQFAYGAASDAIRDAGLGEEALRDERCGIVFGNDSCVKAAVDAIDVAREAGETHPIGSGSIFRTMNSTVTMNLATQFGVGGASWTLSAACASGGHALGQATALIRSGLQDIVIAGGAQEINWESMASFDALGVFSTREDAPGEASRPFDAERDGLVPSGGAACLVLEDLERAQARGARIYGIISGYGFSCDSSGHLSQPNGTGAARAIRMALRDAGVDPGDIDYVNAHGTSTPVGDLVEARAISEVFGDAVPVSSTKSMTGHECWMAGASEMVYTVLMAREGFVAPNLNLTKIDEACPPIQVVAETTPATIRKAVSNSFGFGGTNAVLVVDFDAAT
ncbi:MAG: beta-ketoacyl-[acyl-carrier-protein] synthase family protein [bacterium]|nr:beta-ketoacyl-[acyl-carrier-protein] synthase family protein [bacterium]